MGQAQKSADAHKLVLKVKPPGFLLQMMTMLRILVYLMSTLRAFINPVLLEGELAGADRGCVSPGYEIIGTGDETLCLLRFRLQHHPDP